MKNREISPKKAVVLNLVASFVTYVVTFGISFFLSPYIVRTVGVDAYGFVSLANNFISYASLITIALNSLAGRFITIKLKNRDLDSANKYFSSVFLGNAFLASVMFVVALFVWIFLEKIINIPNDLFWDVKILFAILFLNCILNTIMSVYGVATFATNKLYLNSIRQIEASIIRAVILVMLFALCPAKVFYLGIATLVMGVYSLAYSVYYTHKLTPELRINKKKFDMKAVIELVTSGIWNLINRLGQILTDGLDLLITNLFIDATSMGILSLAKTVPSIITGIVGTMVGSFSPNFTILYAENKMDELKDALKQSMKIMGIITNLPIIILIVCGERFFTLWQPTQNAKQLQVLSILTIGTIIFSGGITCIYNIFTVVNKLKVNSLVVVGCGVLNTIIVFILVKTTSLGVYAVAGVSTVISILRNIIFTAPYGAKCLKLKWYTFLPDVFRPVLFVLISVIPCYFINGLFISNSWIVFILVSAITGVVSMFIGAFVVLRKKDRVLVVSIIKSKIRKEH